MPGRNPRGVADALSREGVLVRLAVFGIAAVASILVAFHIPFAEPLTDLFEEGEYLAPRLFFASGAGGLPLLIHGYINYLPAEWALGLCGPDRVIACTRAVNTGFTALAAFGFVGCSVALARSREALFFSLFGALAILLLIDGRMYDTVSLQQGTSSVRDAWLLIEVWCLLATAGRAGRSADLLAAAAGLVAGGSLFWAYNRGLIGVLVVPLYAATAWWSGRGLRHAAAPLAGLVAGTGLAMLAEPAMWWQHLSNVGYWAQNAAIWALPFSWKQTLYNSSFYPVVAAVLVFGAWRVWQLAFGRASRAELPLTAVLLAVVGLISQQAWRRGDSMHLMFVMPWLFLLGLQLANGLAAGDRAPDPTWRALVRRQAPLLAGLLGILFLDFHINVSVTRPLVTRTAANLVSLVHGLPVDRALISPGAQAVAASLRASDPGCTYVLNNAGAYYHLADRRPCSPVMYPIYASPTAERRVIADLARTSPALIVGTSDEWFSSIDQRPLAGRTPLLARWIEVHYPVVRCIGSTELRRRAANVRGGGIGHACLSSGTGLPDSRTLSQPE
jgi:hypothetical protein